MNKGQDRMHLDIPLRVKFVYQSLVKGGEGGAVVETETSYSVGYVVEVRNYRRRCV